MVLGTNDFGVYSVNVLIKMAANVLGQLMLNIQIHLQLNPLTTDDTYCVILLWLHVFNLL